MTSIPVHSAHLTGTPLGTIRLWATPGGLRRVAFRNGPDLARSGEHLGEGPPPPHLALALQALREYMAGRRRAFDDIPLDLGPVTPFQRRVYDRLVEIPWGRVTTYGALADALEAGAGSARAVGQAVGANPVAILIPCHRVVASDHTLVGFGGGLDRKAALLRLEGLVVDGVRPSSRVHPGELRLPI